MEERARIPVSLPRPNPTTSYWQESPDEIANLQSTKALPQYADYVIIGSGISGAAIAYNLLEKKPNSSVLMLEARQACSGATGRNGGHTKAASYRSFLDHEAEHGIDEAIKIARLEYANIKQTHALARELNIDCASTPCDTVDIIYDAANLARGKEAIARMQETMGLDDPAAKYTVLSAEEAKEQFYTPDALGAFVYEAGSVSSYRFTIGLLKHCIEKGLNLQTNTPVEAIVSDDDFDSQSPRWIAQTPRGSVETANLVVATNGYTAHLLPQMQGIIVPLRGQITAQRPGSKLPGLDTTYSFIYASGYEYMISRPPGTSDAGTIIIGGGLGRQRDAGASEFGNTLDAELNREISTYLYDCTAGYFGDNWGEDAKGGRIVKEWSGVMGTSSDGLPYVGAMPDMPGVFISASFNGHGMVMCLKSGEALVDIIVEGGEQEWFPKALVVGAERFERKFQGRLDMRAPGEALFDDRMERL
ncbi:FAD dependent oxidoreductase [Aureobasidium pullulans]|uniref:FAD dependent oxidoreductase n=1 Tax=Aureobasidium pullulans TaxID=5580 RepID=A0A4S9V7X2_AURPU|nr:FAD dependent oxidoreductase [Aureobasidium pullulans]THZ47770.1 FAD dependent oxidoreductase [Aureobasidium pullulans]THZ58851.1 FAD dependent oxidoreductase [Aureobasidium pullulans]